MATTTPGSPKTLVHRQSPAFRKIMGRLARRIRRLRNEHGWTVEGAAERFGVEPAHVRRIESGKANPSLAVLVSIAGALGLTVSELLEEHPKP